MARRTGDVVSIPGDYQYRALTQGNVVQRFWHQSKLWAISDYLPPAPDDRVLDVGCGSGVVASFLAGSGATVVGIDANPQAVAFAARTFSSAKLRFEVGLVDERFRPGSPVDKVYCIEVIEHVRSEQALRMLRSFHRVLRPGGKVFLTTPNYASLWPLIEWAVDVFGKAPPMRGAQHVEKYTGRRLTRLCREAGFEVERSGSMCLLSPWVAAVSWGIGRKLAWLERRLPFRLGCILVFVLAKGAAGA